ncbi:MAG: rhodanese-like domain-containing protein [Rhodanobacteraceae bacterium]|jgi:rhodanese-related sulfurtransferase|nr:rhodanese-like domain-containing protein [Rhodanobacteraceae bacterium]
MSDFLHRLPEFLGNHLYLTLAFVGVLIALVVVEVQRFTRGYTALTPAGLTQLINRENALLIDLSSLADFEKGHIPGARQVALSQFDPESKDLAKAKDLPVALVCRSGQTSAQAAQRLKKAGFSRVFWLEGGLGAWAEAQMPLAKGRA